MFELKLAAGAFACALIAETELPNFQEFGVIGAVALSALSGIAIILRWLTSHITTQEQRFTAERTQDRESWQSVAREWKECHKETCTQNTAAMKELTTAIRDGKKP